MSARPFTSRRRRRCALGRHCPEGGRIPVGARALRVRPHVYVHAGDPAWVRERARLACTAAAGVMAVLGDAFDHLAAVMREVVPSIEAVVASVRAEVRADVAERLLDWPVAVGSTDNPMAVRVVADARLPEEAGLNVLGECGALLLLAGYEVVDTPSAVLARWTPDVESEEVDA